LSVPTATGAVVGTPRYISPEGAAGEHVDHRADLYAAALVLYMMLAGRSPFDRVQATGVFSAKGSEDPAPLSSTGGNSIAPELDAVISKALRRNPDERFQNAADFKAAIEAVERSVCGFSEPLAAGAAEHAEALDALDTTLAADSLVASERTRVEREAETRTAHPRARRSSSIAASPGIRRLAAASALLFITVLAFAVGVGLVRVVQVYFARG